MASDLHTPQKQGQWPCLNVVVELGNPAYACQRQGICKMWEANKPKPRRANQVMAIAQMGSAHLSLWFLKTPMHPYLTMKHFGKEHFVIETPFVIPGFVYAPDSLANWAIPEGKYPILKQKDFFTIHFDIAALPESTPRPDTGSTCAHHHLQFF